MGTENENLASYRKAVEFFAKSKTDNLMFNSGNEHAAIIFSNIFLNSSSCVKIFAGNLHNEVTEKPEYINSIIGFLQQKDSKLDILLDGFDGLDGRQDSQLFKKLFFFKEKIVVKSTKVKFHVTRKTEDGTKKDHIHFCTGDSQMYRLEIDTTNRTARCNFNDPPFVKILNNLFDTAFSDGQIIDWNMLTNIDESD
jgi:hypothetical protein